MVRDENQDVASDLDLGTPMSHVYISLLERYIGYRANMENIAAAPSKLPILTPPTPCPSTTP